MELDFYKKTIYANEMICYIQLHVLMIYDMFYATNHNLAIIFDLNYWGNLLYVFPELCEGSSLKNYPFWHSIYFGS